MKNGTVKRDSVLCYKIYFFFFSDYDQFRFTIQFQQIQNFTNYNWEVKNSKGLEVKMAEHVCLLLATKLNLIEWSHLNRVQLWVCNGNKSISVVMLEQKVAAEIFQFPNWQVQTFDSTFFVNEILCIITIIW